MAQALLEYQSSDLARFDFQVPDGVGGFVLPDMDGTLSVEFRDSADVLQFTATTTSTPALTQGTDDDGPFVQVNGIDVSTWAVGNVEARVFAKVSGADVLPSPTISTAFKIIADVGTQALYTTTTKVKDNLPSGLPAELTDSLISEYIADGSRTVDGYLQGRYTTPFAAIGDSPPTPRVIEMVARKLAVGQCRLFMGQINDENPDVNTEQAIATLKDMAAGKIKIDGYSGGIATAEIDRDYDTSEDLLGDFFDG